MANNIHRQCCELIAIAKICGTNVMELDDIKLMFWLQVSVWCFDGFFVWVVSLLAGGRSMSPQFQKVHRPPLLPITDKFP